MMIPRYSSTQEGCGTADIGVRARLMLQAHTEGPNGNANQFWGAGKTKSGIAQVGHLNKSLKRN